MTAVITLPSVWVLIQVCFVANKEAKIINYKNYTQEMVNVKRATMELWMLDARGRLLSTKEA